jgi:hypothetical protein
MPARISVREARRLGLLPDDPPLVIEAPSLKAAAWTVIIGYAARKAMHLALAASAVLAVCAAYLQSGRDRRRAHGVGRGRDGMLRG